jgi:hypothetical protein
MTSAEFIARASLLWERGAAIYAEIIIERIRQRSKQ